MLRLRTKVEAVGVLCLLVCLSVMSVFAVTRTISDTGDTAFTYILNSDGEYFDATGANIEVAYIATTSPGWVKVPVGVFEISDDIQLLSGVSIYGSGMYVTTIREAAAGTSTNGLIEGSSDNNITLSDFTLDVNGDAATTNNGIDLNTCSDITIENIRILYPDWNAIRVYGTGNTRTNIRNCYIEDCLTASYHAMSFVDSINSQISGIVVKNGGTGASIDLESTSFTTMDNIICYNVQQGIKLPSTNNVTIQNVILYGTSDTYHAIHVTTGHDILISNYRVTGGFLSGLRVDSTGYNINVNNVVVDAITGNDGIVVYGDNVTMTNIRIYDIDRFGIDFEGCNNVIVSDFDISDCGVTSSGAVYFNGCNNVKLSNGFIYGMLGLGTHGIYLLGDTNTTITNVEISGITEYGIYGKNGKFASISDCTIHDCGNDGIDFTAATVLHNFSISDCFFKNNAKAIDIGATANYFIISGNICATGDIIDLSGSVNNATSYCNKFDNVASITWA